MKTAVQYFSIFIAILSFLAVSSCKSAHSEHIRGGQYALADSLVTKRTPTDSLLRLLERFKKEDNLPGQMRSMDEIGKRYRESSDFDKALSFHLEALSVAEQLNDTSQMVQILNQTGTDYRRIGILEEASKYHYKALALSDIYIKSHTDYNSRKNRVVSLNGIGNIYLTLEDYKSAKDIFRMSLAGEKELGSALGQAINYANLGYIFEAEGQIDSARVYYGLSMDFNREAGSDMGVSLCHGHFGRLAEDSGNLDNALEEYRQAYEIMYDNPDRWHWIESCISLARVHLKRNEPKKAESYLMEGIKTAQQIGSLEFLAQVYLLSSQWHEQNGRLGRALEDYRKSVGYSDQVVNEKNLTQLQNLRLNHERETNRIEIEGLRQRYEDERSRHRMMVLVSLGGFVLALLGIGVLFYVLRLRARAQRIMRQMAKTRQNFFTNITHEFRTPLTVIMGMAADLKSRCTDKASIRDFDILLRNADSLLLLVNQLLDIAKVNTATGRPDWRHGDVITLLKMNIENIKPYADRSLVDLEFASSAPEIHMDFIPDYINKITTNLLSNAVKFSDKGDKVSIMASAKSGNLVLTVSDTGSGIDSDDLQKIFEPFYQGSNSSGRTGTGIGLPLVKQMSLAMGGKTDVYSIKGQGSSFVVTLPLKHSGTEQLPLLENDGDISVFDTGRTSAPKDIDCEKYRILIVEDNADIAEYIGRVLEDDYNLIFAQSGEHGLAKAEEYVPDIIISDVMMPGMDGYEMCVKIRNSETLNHIPIIIITARNEDEDRMTGLKCGADAYLVKPFNPDELQTLASNILRAKELLRKKLSEAMEDGNEASAEIPEAEKAFITKLHSIVMTDISNPELNSEHIADKVFMSRSQLNRKVKAITGIDTASYIRRTRMSYAGQLLCSSDIQIGDIVIQCGFESAPHFSKTFRQHFDMTPSEYRKAKCRSKKL